MNQSIVLCSGCIFFYFLFLCLLILVSNFLESLYLFFFLIPQRLWFILSVTLIWKTGMGSTNYVRDGGKGELPQSLLVCLCVWLFLLGSIECKRQVGLGWRQYWRYIKGRGNAVFTLASLFSSRGKSWFLILMLRFKRFCAFSYQKRDQRDEGV